MSDNPRTTIKLERPLVTGDGPVMEIVLRDPLYSDYRALGELVTFAYDDQGRGVPVEMESVIFGYVERCLVSPKSFLLLEHVTLNDARKLRQWVLRFFRSDAVAKEGSTTSSQTSSGEPAASPSTAH